MSGGYDKFFKQAKKASEQQGKGSGNAGGKSKAPGKKPAFGSAKGKGSMKFSIDTGREMDPARSAKLTPEDHLRLELARRLQAKKKSVIRKRQEFPKFPALCVVLALASASVGYFYPETAELVVKRLNISRYVDIGFLGSASAAEAAKAAPKKDKAEAKAAETKPATQEIAAASKGESKDEAVPNIRNWTSEELSFFNKLNDRKKELDLREAELAKLEGELQKQKEALDEKIKQLEAMRSQISQTLKSRVTTDQQKVDKLVDFYSNMKPQQAAKVIETLNEDLSVEVLDKMKKKNAAEILNAMDSKKARRLSELLTGYQRTPASSSGAGSDEKAEAGEPASAQ